MHPQLRTLSVSRCPLPSADQFLILGAVIHSRASSIPVVSSLKMCCGPLAAPLGAIAIQGIENHEILKARNPRLLVGIHVVRCIQVAKT
jgi:hypothetical protein